MYHHLLYDICMQCSAIYILWPLWTTFHGYILLSTAIYCFRWPYTTFDGYILLSTAASYFRRLFTSFDCYILLSTAIYYFRSYILLLALTDCDFIRTQDFSAIPRICGIKARLKASQAIILLPLIQFYFFCTSMVSSINLNWPFWKCCFFGNIRMLKKWNFFTLRCKWFTRKAWKAIICIKQILKKRT